LTDVNSLEDGNGDYLTIEQKQQQINPAFHHLITADDATIRELKN
jgi:hypothetical protein